jgi:uncharacterized protein RhaS with RHS repeats
MSYSPTLGRWIQTDPAGYVDGPNLYEYVRSRPVSATDPLGLAARPATQPGTQPVKPNILPKPVFAGFGAFTLQQLMSTTGEVGAGIFLQTWLQFDANPKNCPPCKKIRLVQAIRFTEPGKGHTVPDTLKGFDDLMTAGDKTNPDKSKWVDPGWIIDFRNTTVKRGRPASPYYNDHSPSNFGGDGFIDPPGAGGNRAQKAGNPVGRAVCAEHQPSDI